MQKYIGTISINAKPMTRGEYSKLRNWEIPADENPADEGYLVEYTDSPIPNIINFSNYVSWLPKDVFERAYQAQPVTTNPSEDDLVTEEMIKARDLEARRVSVNDLHDSIKDVEILRHRLPNGSCLRFAILHLENGFVVTGRPSVSISAENDNDEVGTKIAIQNAVHELWPFVGFKAVLDKAEQE